MSNLRLCFNTTTARIKLQTKNKTMYFAKREGWTNSYGFLASHNAFQNFGVIVCTTGTTILKFRLLRAGRKWMVFLTMFRLLEVLKGNHDDHAHKSKFLLVTYVWQNNGLLTYPQIYYFLEENLCRKLKRLKQGHYLAILFWDQYNSL